MNNRKVMSINMSFSKKTLSKITSKDNAYNLHSMIVAKLIDLFDKVIKKPLFHNH